MVDQATVEEVRGLRSKEQWLRYDSVVIGPGAKLSAGVWSLESLTAAGKATIDYGGPMDMSP